MIEDNTMISVPAQVLQGLIWNYELNTAGSGPTNICEETMAKQCDELQAYLTPEGYVDPNKGFTLEPFTKGDNVHFVDFGKRV
jgi:hypothetical protein